MKIDITFLSVTDIDLFEREGPFSIVSFSAVIESDPLNVDVPAALEQIAKQIREGQIVENTKVNRDFKLNFTT
jgi:hypothetical protein